MLGVVTGLTAEAKIAQRLGVPVRAGGGTPEGAERAARELATLGVTALLSFGLAGGLDPELQPGDLIVPNAVVEDGRIRIASRLLSGCLGEARHGMLLSYNRIVTSVAEKAELSKSTLCRVVDMESGAVARVAEMNGLPFAVLRAVCDDAARTLPDAASAALNSKGAIAISRVALSVLLNPLQIPALITLGRDAGRARAALVGRVHQISVSGFGSVL